MLHFVKFLGFVLIFYDFKLSYGANSPEVVIKQGKLKGVFMKSTLGREFSAFQTIPFAKPPLGELRFKAPVEADGWKGVLDATEDAPICIQSNPYVRSTEITGTEDCLYLNVYTPKTSFSDDKLLPVMVFFHGGGWMCGSGNKMFYGPERLMDKEVVYVGVNYRLGLLSLFSTQDLAAPGNCALKDQNLALKWIQKNIKEFGGDPNSVTLFGESAGGASVHYHMLSPKSKGLFHRAISHSGTAQCVWANPPPEVTARRAHLLAKQMNCPADDSFALVECLRRKPAEELVAADIIFYDWDFDPMIPFKPIVEPEHEDAFLTEDPRLLGVEGRFYQVPWMLGLNEKEGALRSASIFGVSNLLKELSENFDKLAPITFYYQYSKDVQKITKEIKRFYFDGKVSLTNDSISTLTDIYTDTYFLSGIDETLRLHLDKLREPVYFYYFKYRGRNSFTEIFGDPHRDYGTCHVDELIYLFNLDLFPQPLSENDAKMSDTLLTLWTNFATSGDPNKPEKSKYAQVPKWKPLTSVETMEYLSIGNKITMETRLLEERRKFWHNLPLWPKDYSAAYKKNEKIEL